MKHFQLIFSGILILVALLSAGCGLFSKKSPYDLAREGNLEMLKRFLDEGGDVNGTYGGQDRSLLFGAVEGEKADAARFLIERGADIHFRDSYESTPLIHAVSHGNLESVKLLLDKGAEVNAVNKSGLSPIYRAVRKKKWEIAGLLLDHGADVNFKDEGASILHLAVQQGDLKMVRILLDHKVRVNVKNKIGFTPLFYAEEFSFREISRLLRKAGARMKHPAPTEAYYRKVYDQRIGKGPMRVRRVFKFAGPSLREVYSKDGSALAQVLNKDISGREDIYPDFISSYLESPPDDENRDRTYILRIYDVAKGKPKYPDMDLPDEPYGMEFAPDGRLLLTNTRSAGIEVRDPATGKRLRKIGQEEGVVLATGRVDSSRYVVSGEDKRAFWNVEARLLSSMYPVFKEMFGGLEHSLWVYDYETGALVREFRGYRGVVEQADFSFDGRYLASISGRTFENGGPLKIWEAGSGRPIRVQRNLGSIHDIIPFPKDRRLAAVNYSRTRILDMENGQVIRDIRHGGNHAGLLGGGRYLVFLKYEHLALVNLKTGRVVQEASFNEELNRLGEEYGTSEHFTSLKASPDGDSFLITTSHGKMIVFDISLS